MHMQSNHIHWSNAYPIYHQYIQSAGLIFDICPGDIPWPLVIDAGQFRVSDVRHSMGNL